MPPKKSPLAAYLVECRRRRGWSQEHLAAAAGIGVRTLQRLEARGTADWDTLRALAHALSLDPEVLFQLRPAAAPAGVLPGLGHAGALVELLAAAAGHELTHEEPQEAREHEALDALRSDVADVVDVWPRLSPRDRGLATEALQEHLEGLAALGWGLFGALHEAPDAGGVVRRTARLHAARLTSGQVRPERRVRQALQSVLQGGRARRRRGAVH